jgi:ribosome-associated translation inhibitor RaiA
MPSESSSSNALEFNARISQYMTDAEVHLKLPSGTITGARDESDFLFVVKMCAVLEPLIKEAVREHVKRKMERVSSPVPKSDTLIKEIGELGSDRLRKILVEFDAIDERLSNFLHALFQVRHRYAHHIANAHLSVAEVCDKIAAEKGGDPKLIDKLATFDTPVPRDELTPDNLRSIMFFKIALVLQATVSLAKPLPPLPRLSGGLFGGTLFETPLPLKTSSTS